MKYKLSDSLQKSIEKTLENLRVSLPARIERYDSSTQKAEVSPLLEKRNADGSSSPLPVIPNVPVLFPRGGKARMTFPLERGDSVLLIFSDRSLDRWLSGSGQSVVPDDPRKHDLSDAVAIPGLLSFGSGGEAGFEEDGDNLIIKHDGTKVVVEPSGKIEIEGDVEIDGDLTVSGDLEVSGNIEASGVSASGDVTAGLISLQNHTHISGPSGSPTGPPLP